jgi:hypothetical protein
MQKGFFRVYQVWREKTTEESCRFISFLSEILTDFEDIINHTVKISKAARAFQTLIKLISQSFKKEEAERKIRNKSISFSDILILEKEASLISNTKQKPILIFWEVQKFVGDDDSFRREDTRKPFDSLFTVFEY